MIAEPLYLVTRRAPVAPKGTTLTLAALIVSNKRASAAAEALRLCDRGQSTVVYECRIIEVHHPTKKARRERKERMRRKRAHK
jgi:hypothetical protein